ncbi:hypothetical protein ACFWNK_23630 [Streptomyces sp. NPDC058417]|uniref:hypothetical protein n=1 Tax=unclassified Streptomyces TaxID=2593676 RepID=UPI00365CFFD3
MADAASTVTEASGTVTDTTGTVTDASGTDELVDVAAVRAEAVWAADHACMVSRSAPARLVPVLLPLLDAPESAPAVLSLLDKIGEHAGAAADTLARLAGEDGPSADLALTVLVTADPERAAPLLAAHLPTRPRALAAASGARDVGNTPPPPPFPFDAALLDAVRRRLSGGAQGGDTGGDAAGPPVSAKERTGLALLLASWGVRAASAVPELLDALPTVAVIGPKALAAVCPADGQARVRTVTRLREAATGGPDEGRLAAGHALYVLAGDSGPLLAAIRPRLAEPGFGAREAARLVGVLGEAARPLVPEIRATLRDRADGRALPRLDADAELAVALWEITGDTDTDTDTVADSDSDSAVNTAVAVLDAVIRADAGPWTRWTALRAARRAVRMGPAARPLRPVLEDLLATPPHAPAAVLALLAALPETDLRGPLDRTVLAGRVLDAAEHGVETDTAFEALAALGRESLTDAHARRLADLAERDRRVVTSGIEDQIIRADDRLADRARATLAALRPERPA